MTPLWSFFSLKHSCLDLYKAASCQLQVQVVSPVQRGPLTPHLTWALVTLATSLHGCHHHLKQLFSGSWSIFLTGMPVPQRVGTHLTCSLLYPSDQNRAWHMEGAQNTKLRNEWVWSGSLGVSSWAVCQGLTVWLSVERLVPGAGMLLARPH